MDRENVNGSRSHSSSEHKRGLRSTRERDKSKLRKPTREHGVVG